MNDLRNTCRTVFVREITLSRTKVLSHEEGRRAAGPASRVTHFSMNDIQFPSFHQGKLMGNSSLSEILRESIYKKVIFNQLRAVSENYPPSNEGFPPFVGARMMEQGGVQKQDMEIVFGKIQDLQDLDYVTCWYKKAADICEMNPSVSVAFVSTNSVCQGSQVPILWGILLNQKHLEISFAHQTFKWSSEASEKAAVHCVIVGFNAQGLKTKKTLFLSNGTIVNASNISPYLTEGPSLFVEAHKDVLCKGLPKMNMGNMARDGGHFFLSEAEKDEVLKTDPALAKWIHPLVGADEFIKGKKRWCFWLDGITPAEIAKSRIIYERVQAVREFRLASNAKTTRGYAKIPHLWAQVCQPKTNFIVVPVVSSEKREYIPMGFLTPDNIPTTQVQIIPEANLYHFGVLESSVHMAWMRVVAGRLEMRYRYSKEIVYNNFPWITPSDSQRNRIEKTAQSILDARALYPDCSLAQLYDVNLMPPELRKAHRANDVAVLEAYGFPKDATESDIVARLFKMYQELTK